MRGILLIAAVLASGCDKSDPSICGSLPAQLPGLIPKSADDQMQLTAYCVERWAARLSHSPDDASQVVEAVIGACDGAIIAYEAAKAKEDKANNVPRTEAYDYWRKRAQFVAVQTRAGNCYPDA